MTGALTPKVREQAGVHTRITPLSARGEPMIWLTGLSLTVATAMIAALLGIVIYNGAATYWPRPIELVTLRDGKQLIGTPMRDESYDPGPDARAALAKAVESQQAPADSIDSDGLTVRRLFRVGNREVLGTPFRWVDLADITDTKRPADAAFLERLEWGVWIGTPKSVILTETLSAKVTPAAPLAASARVETPAGPLEAKQEVLGTPDADGNATIRRTAVLASGPEETLRVFAQLHPTILARRHEAERMKKSEIGAINHDREAARLALRKVELAVEKGRATDAEFTAAKAKYEARKVELDRAFDAVRAKIAAIESDIGRYRIIVEDPATGRFAPRNQREMDEPLPVAQVVRLIAANQLSTAGKVGVYFSRLREFLLDDPREANTEGGVFPVIFGTVMMTLLLSLLVVPFGVVAALYLREYATQGLIVSIVRICVNNLAGVPSIVYGVFGLGFFCYTVGAFIDGGPSSPATPLLWWISVVAAVVVAALGAVVQSYSKPLPGKQVRAHHKALAWISLATWIALAGIIIFAVVSTPYFEGLFRERLPTATYGTKGLLWASLTLALLTLPVVIVATEEAISAVPRSLREGSYGCGASKWQTIVRIVLPRAAPGIMTGAILAMARGAGEVAPLMLVGAVKLAPELPFEGRFPFIFPERSFMHLGFHIYDLGFQSPDSEAAKPLVWTTTLLLILIILVLNLSAILLRARLRKKFVSAKF